VTVICLAAIAWLALLGPAWAADDLTLLHVTDPHVPHALSQTRETLAALPLGDEVRLAPHGVSVPAPSLIVVTGDLNEFSGGGGWWEQYLELWQGLSIPIYHQLGNHDNTWECGRPRLRELHGSVFYAFEQAGIKFIGWDTATPQDPRPSIAEEGLRWLTAEFEHTPPEQPIIFLCHHAPDGREFAGAYDRARLLDLLHTRNVVLMLVGHGHSARAWQVEGLDVVMGGSTFGNRPGFGIVSIQGDVLRVCHQYAGGEMVALLEGPLPERSPFLEVEVSPPDGAVFPPGQAPTWTARAEPPGGAQTGRWTLDGEQSGNMRRDGAAWSADLAGAEIEPGAHVVRVELTDAHGRVTSRTVSFWTGGGDFEVAWRQRLGGSCQSTPTIARGRVCVGSNDGTMSVFEAATGEPLWQFATGGEVRSTPLVSADGDTLYFGSADGNLYAVDPDGAEIWRFDAGGAIYGSPLLVGELVVCGTADGDVVALERGTGALAWRSGAPEYAIEVAPCAGEDGVYVGSWDRYAYALELATGELRWRRPSAGSDREGFVARYYSPADCAPACAGPNVFFADRAYRLTVFDARTGERVMAEEKCVAVAASGDGRFVYVRHSDGRVSKRGADGAAIWTADVPTGAVATPPVPAGRYVWVLSNLGTLSALDEETGAVIAQQRVTRDLYAFAAPAFDGERVYVADMAGRLTALAPTWLPAGP